MKSLYFAIQLIILGSLTKIQAQELYFPPTIGNTWATISPDSLGWCPDKIEDLFNYLEDKNSKAFILLKDGKIVLEKYFGTFTADSSWYWASAGKSLTSFLVGLAQEQDHLDINHPSSQYLGEGWTSLSSEKEILITVRNQLSMTSGLDDGVVNQDCTLPECLLYKDDAGNRWAYHNAPYTLLDQVIESATGQNLNQFLLQNLSSGTGINGLYLPVDFNNVFFSKARSMARFGLLMLNRGKWNQTQIMTDSDYFEAMINSSQDINPAYGYLWWLNGKTHYRVPGLQINIPGHLCPNAPPDMYAALGKNGQFLNVVPSQNLVFIRMGNSPGESVPYLYNDSIWQYINEFDCTLSSNEANEEQFDLSLFPQPAADFLNIHLPAGQMLKGYHIYDLQGKELQSGTESSIELSKLVSGIYTITVKTQKGILTRKWIKS